MLMSTTETVTNRRKRVQTRQLFVKVTFFSQVSEIIVCTRGRRDNLCFRGHPAEENVDDISQPAMILRKNLKPLKSLLFPSYKCVSSKMDA